MASFTKATRQAVFLKLGITGPPGSGKTMAMLKLATALADGGKVAVLDTENNSASLYADKFDFDVLPIDPPFDDLKFIQGIELACREGYKVVGVDSASHAWEGVLEFKSDLDRRPGSNSYTNWAIAGPKFKAVMNGVLQTPIHVICCMRSKMDYVLEEDEKTHKKKPRKIGLAPIMRDGTEYEFTVVWDLQNTGDFKAEVSKDRTSLFSGRYEEISDKTGKKLLAWLKSAPTPAPVPTPNPPHAETPKALPFNHKELSSAHQQIAEASARARDEGGSAQDQPDQLESTPTPTDQQQTAPCASDPTKEEQEAELERNLEPRTEWVLSSDILRTVIDKNEQGEDWRWHGYTEKGVLKPRHIWTIDPILGKNLQAANGQKCQMRLQRGTVPDIHKLLSIVQLDIEDKEPDDIHF